MPDLGRDPHTFSQMLLRAGFIQAPLESITTAFVSLALGPPCLMMARRVSTLRRQE